MAAMTVFGAAVSVVVAAVVAQTPVVVVVVVVEEEETQTASGATAMEVVFGYVGDAILSQTPSHECFKHGWLKALAAANMSLAVPIPYEQVDVEPLESDFDS
ncbi:hypothetical protein CsSME_00018157 [Camellia sinensis var. sinensis]